MKTLVVFLALLFAVPSFAIADDPVGGGLCPIHLHGLTMIEFGKQAECLSKIIDRQLKQQGWAKVYYNQACKAQPQVLEYIACKYYTIWWEVTFGVDGRGGYIYIWYGGRTP